MGRNAWNDFQRAHGGQGLTRTEMSAMYHAQNGGGGSAHVPSAWNTFQHAHAGHGLTSAQMAVMYREEKREKAAPPPKAYYPPMGPTLSESTRREKEKMAAEQIGRFSLKKQQEKEVKSREPVGGFARATATPQPSIDPTKPVKSVFGNAENKMRQETGGFGAAGFGAAGFGATPSPSTGLWGFGNEKINVFGTGVPISSFSQRNLFGGGAFGIPTTQQQQGTASPTYGFGMDNVMLHPSFPHNDDERYFVARAYVGRSALLADISPEEARHTEYHKAHKRNARVHFTSDVVGKEGTVREIKHGVPTKTQTQAPRVDVKDSNKLRTVRTSTNQHGLESAGKVKVSQSEEMKSHQIGSIEPPSSTKQSPSDVESDTQSQVNDVHPESSETNADTSAAQFASVREHVVPQSTSPSKQESDARESTLQGDEENEPRLNLLISDEMLIASGSTGDVYRAFLGESTPVAVKVIRNVKSKRTFARTREEIMKLQSLPDHPYLVRYYGDGPLDDGCFVGVVMELVDGSQPLDSRRHRLDEKQKHSILLRLLDALVVLHSHGLTHRDLSLHHVLMSADGENAEPSIKLIDFGIPTLKNAAATYACLKSLSPPQLAGCNPAYASPELLRGELRHDDEDGWKKSDVFSFTVLMVELLMDELPWEGELPVAFINAVSKQCERPYNLQDLRIFGTRSPDLETVVTKAWHQDPIKRPSAAKLRLTLQQIFAQAREENRSIPASTKDEGL